jgi:hypothetical protein
MRNFQVRKCTMTTSKCTLKHIIIPSSSLYLLQLSKVLGRLLFARCIPVFPSPTYPPNIVSDLAACTSISESIPSTLQLHPFLRADFVPEAKEATGNYEV